MIIFGPASIRCRCLAESLALLPPESRWNVSFCTYFSKLPPGLDCQWRCVLEGSPEAIANQRLPGALVIDLGKPRGAAPSSPAGAGRAEPVWPRWPGPDFTTQPAVPAPTAPNDAELAQLFGASAPAPQPPAPGLSPSPISAPPVEDVPGTGIYGLGPPARSQNAMDLPPPVVRIESSSENRRRNGRLSEA